MSSKGKNFSQSSYLFSRAATFLRRTPSLSDPKVSFEGKTVIVTGANSGLGFEAAVKFVSLGASQVILGVRDLSKGENAKLEIQARTGKIDQVQVWHLDMNSYDSIQEFAKRSSSLARLDVAVLNAGVYMVNFEKSKYGWEETLQVNVLSTALLGLLLLPKLKASRTETSVPCLEFVSSGNHEKVTISAELQQAGNLLRDYNSSDAYNASQQYAVSKLFLMYAIRTLAYRVRASDVVITSVCPGYCKSNLSRGHKGFLMGILRALAFTFFLRETEEGARSLVSGATLGEIAHGGFWQNDQLKPLTPLLSGKEGEELRQMVWSEIVESLKKDVANTENFISECKA